jgi:hypothetical protein
MRLMLAMAVAALMAASPSFAQNTAPAPEPTSPNAAKTEDAMSGKTPPKDARSGKQEDGNETGWGGQWKAEDGKAEASRNEAEGKSVKQPEQGK